jgi:tripartite-type tricarboxylate transporter receptor subunit TctC
MMLACRAIALACLAVGVLATSAAAAYPDKPVRMIVPFAAGGPLDLTARVFGEKLGASLGQNFLVDNRTGAAGNIGMDVVAKAPPDGYTLLWVLDSMVTVNPALYKGLKVDPQRDLAPIALISTNTSVLVVHTAVAAKDVAALVALARKQPLAYASAGSGSPGHRYMEFFKLLAGVPMTHVPYKGNQPASQSIAAGETQVFMAGSAGVLPHLRSGKVRALAALGPERLAELPDVPTMREAGYPRMVMESWFALYAPAATPPAILAQLHRECERIMTLPDVSARMVALTLKPIVAGPDMLRERARNEAQLWAEIVRETGMTAD